MSGRGLALATLRAGTRKPVLKGCIFPRRSYKVSDVESLDGGPVLGDTCRSEGNAGKACLHVRPFRGFGGNLKTRPRLFEVRRASLKRGRPLFFPRTSIPRPLSGLEAVQNGTGGVDDRAFSAATFHPKMTVSKPRNTTAGVTVRRSVPAVSGYVT